MKSLIVPNDYRAKIKHCEFLAEVNKLEGEKRVIHAFEQRKNPDTEFRV